MRLFVGLGNPGTRYAGNRHNVGYMVVDAIARRHNFGPWRRRFQGQAAEGALGAYRVLLLKPSTTSEMGPIIVFAELFVSSSVCTNRCVVRL